MRKIIYVGLNEPTKSGNLNRLGKECVMYGCFNDFFRTISCFAERTKFFGLCVIPNAPFRQSLFEFVTYVTKKLYEYFWRIEYNE